MIHGTQHSMCNLFSFKESRLVFAVEENASNCVDYNS